MYDNRSMVILNAIDKASLSLLPVLSQRFPYQRHVFREDTGSNFDFDLNFFSFVPGQVFNSTAGSLRGAFRPRP